MLWPNDQTVCLPLCFTVPHLSADRPLQPRPRAGPQQLEDPPQDLLLSTPPLHLGPHPSPHAPASPSTPLLTIPRTLLAHPLRSPLAQLACPQECPGKDSHICSASAFTKHLKELTVNFVFLGKRTESELLTLVVNGTRHLRCL